MNLNLYHWAGQWLMLDCGMMIDGDAPPESRVLIPDISFITERGIKLAGLVITHAHEDHIGAVGALARHLECPIHATPFAAEVIRGRLSEYGRAELIEEHAPGARFKVGPFGIQYIPITHSTPESQSVVITTPLGSILHTGDWKLDPEPLVGQVTHEKRFRALGKANSIIAAVADSTNATHEGHSGSEASTREAILELAANRPGRIIASCFSSNIARLQTLIEAALQSDRHPVLLGRSIERMVRAAQTTGYLPRDLPFVRGEYADYLPSEKTLVICTGSQGEAAAALPRIARDAHPLVHLEEGDTAIFCSKIIPGNEVPIAALHQALEKRGVTVFCERDAQIHVSGHPCREELAQMYDWVKPQLVVPVHGYPKHLAAHREFCEGQGIPAVEIRNGDVLRLAPGEAEVVGQVQVGRVVRPEPPSQRVVQGGGSRIYRPRRGRKDRGRRRR
ncbi:MAG: ribonuclease J [Bradymonadia bacterium]